MKRLQAIFLLAVITLFALGGWLHSSPNTASLPFMPDAFAQNPKTSPDAELHLATGNSGAVYVVAFSADGKTLASSSSDNTIKLWDTDSRQERATLSRHKGSVWSVAFSPDDTMLASGSADNTIKLWDTASGQERATLIGHNNSVRSVAFSADGKTLASGGDDNTIKLWDAASGQERAILFGHTRPVRSVAFSKDGKTLASGSADNTIKLWDTASGEERATLIGHTSPVRSVAFSKDGKTLASGSEDNTIKLWDAASGKERATLSEHKNPVRSVAFSPDNKMLASGSADDTIKLWDTDSGRERTTLKGHKDTVWSVAFGKDGKTLASGSEDNTIKLWDTDSGKERDALSGHMGSVRSVAFSTDGTMLASGSADNTVKLWDAASGEERTTPLTGHKDTVWSVAFSKDGKTLASGSADKTIKLWDTDSGKERATLSRHKGGVWSVAFSADGKTLASGSEDNTIKLWDTASGMERDAAFSGHKSPVWSVAFSADGKTLASGSEDNTIKLWDTASGKERDALSGHNGTVQSVAFSKDGKTLASGSADHTIKLWDAVSGKERATLSEHKDSVVSVAFSPDGKTLASGSDDNTIKLWDTDSRQERATLRGHKGSVRELAFSADGKTLAVVGDGTGWLYDLSTSPARLRSATTWLTGFKWISQKPGHLHYAASLQGDEHLFVKFASRPGVLYPARDCYGGLRLSGSALLAAWTAPSPAIEPADWCLRRLNASRWFDQNLTATMLVSSLLFMFVGAFVAFYKPAASSAETTALRFFARAGYARSSKLSAGNAWIVERSDGKALLLSAAAAHNAAALRSEADRHAIKKAYWLTTDGVNDLSRLRDMAQQLGGVPVIPLVGYTLRDALRYGSESNRLRDLEQPYIVQADPYAGTTAVNDEHWFFGRSGDIEQVNTALAQGQHLAVFGLRKVGKTSLLNALKRRFAHVPLAHIDCQTLSKPGPDEFFSKLATDLSVTCDGMGLKGLPSGKVTDASTFAVYLRGVLAAWAKRGSPEPVVIMVDEVDKLLVLGKGPEQADWLRTYVSVFRLLRGLAQESGRLSLVVVAYRPDVSRRNQLPCEVGENPMYSGFRELFLGPLSRTDAADMLVKLGALKGIEWAEGAAMAVANATGGHAMLSRMAASAITDSGRDKQIFVADAEAGIANLRGHFRDNDIGNYYEQVVWGDLNDIEHEMLLGVARGASSTGTEDGAHADARIALERFGLIERSSDAMCIRGTLLQAWLERKL